MLNTKTHVCLFFLCSLPTKGKVVGHNLWPAKQGLYTDLSKARTPDEKKLFVVSTEAFVVTLFDSNYNKWTNMFNYYAEHTNYRINLPKKLTKEEKQSKPGGADPYHDAKYTRQDGGQLELGSFSDEGMDYYDQVAQEIKKERNEKKEEYEQFEAKFRAKLRETHGVSENEEAKDGKKKGKKGRKSGDGGGKVKKRKIIFVDDEE